MIDPNSQTTPAPATANTPPPSAPTAPGSPPAALTAPPGTALQIASMLAAGTIDTTQAGKLARAGNLSTLHVAQALSTLRAAAEPQEPDVRSPEVKALDAALPAANPEAYRITYSGEPGQDPPAMTPELKQFDASARTWLSTAGFPRDVGNSLVTTIAKVTQQTQRMTEGELETYAFAEFAKLERAHDPALEERLRAAGRLVEDLERKQPGLKQLLKSKGIGDSAMVASLLIQQAERYHARKGR
jgi:hypothetical protein